MKKLGLLAMVALVITPVTVVLTACGMGSPRSELVGVWRADITTETEFGSVTSTMTYDFRADGTVMFTVGAGGTGIMTLSGTWGATASRISIRILGETARFGWSLNSVGDILTIDGVPYHRVTE